MSFPAARPQRPCCTPAAPVCDDAVLLLATDRSLTPAAQAVGAAHAAACLAARHPAAAAAPILLRAADGEHRLARLAEASPGPALVFVEPDLLLRATAAAALVHRDQLGFAAGFADDLADLRTPEDRQRADQRRVGALRRLVRTADPACPAALVEVAHACAERVDPAVVRAVLDAAGCRLLGASPRTAGRVLDPPGRLAHQALPDPGGCRPARILPHLEAASAAAAMAGDPPAAPDPPRRTP